MQGLAKTSYKYPIVGPDTIYILAVDYVSIDSGSWIFTENVAMLTNGFFETSAGAVGDSITYNCYLDVGVWTAIVLGMCGTARGICQCTLDGTVLGTFDTYWASTIYNRPWLFGAGVAITTPGIKILNLYATGKNAGSSDERLGFAYIILQKTS